MSSEQSGRGQEGKTLYAGVGRDFHSTDETMMVSIQHNLLRCHSLDPVVVMALIELVNMGGAEYRLIRIAPGESASLYEHITYPLWVDRSTVGPMYL